MTLWCMKMRQYIAITDHILWDIITNGDQATTEPASSSGQPSAPKTLIVVNARRNNEKALNILLSANTDRLLLSFHLNGRRAYNGRALMDFYWLISDKPELLISSFEHFSFCSAEALSENMLVEVGKFTFPANFVILEVEEDSKVPLIFGRPFLHTADAVIRVKQKQLNLGVGTERMIFKIDSTIKHSYSNDDTCFSIEVIDEILEEDLYAPLDEGSKILHSIEGTILKEEIFSEFDKFQQKCCKKN
ncbi:reverse transcriptase domain-containing protein [Tanacetum coccineum]